MYLWDTDPSKPVMTGFFIAYCVKLSHIVDIQLIRDTLICVLALRMVTCLESGKMRLSKNYSDSNIAPSWTITELLEGIILAITPSNLTKSPIERRLRLSICSFFNKTITEPG